MTSARLMDSNFAGTLLRRHRHLLFLLAVSFGIRMVFLALFRDTYLDAGRMMPLYDLAANWASTGRFVADEAFLKGLERYTYHVHPKRNVDYKILRRLVTAPPEINSDPEITDTWGYAVLLGLIWKITGDKSYIYLQFLQVLIDVLAVLAVHGIILLMFGSGGAALAAGYAYALFPTFAFFSVLANRDYYAAWGVIFSFYFFIKGWKSRHSLWWLGNGVCIAFFCWFRASIFPYFLLYLGYTLLFARGKRWKAGLRALYTIFLPPILLFALPFSVQFHEKYGTWNFMSGQTGNWLWTGLGRYESGHHFVLNDRAAHQRAVELGYPRDGPQYVPERSKLLTADAWSVIARDPMFYVSVIVRRYIRFLFARPAFGISERNGVSYSELKMDLKSFIFNYPVEFVEKSVKTVMSYMLPFCAIVSVVLFPARRWWIFMFLGLWQFKLIIHAPLHMENRYIMECYFPVVVMAALSVRRIVGYVRNRTTADDTKATVP